MQFGALADSWLQ